MRTELTLASLSAFALVACADAPERANDTPPALVETPTGSGDLALGGFEAPDSKADGFGAALDCKPVPSLPVLAQPEIFVSIEGQTLRLVDRESGFDRTFPIGPGAIDRDPGSPTFGESLSMHPVLTTGRSTFEITPATIQPCKTWWTNDETGERLPVFAGLPFLSWHGNYGIHGPIDRYTAPNGGTLRRGFVSHGCLRMEAADVLELYARIKGVAKVPVHVQREPERTESGARVDVGEPWIGSECGVDADCTFDGGFCATNPWSGRGFCTRECTRGCPDREGAPVTFCVADPTGGVDAAEATRGICVNKRSVHNEDCRTSDHFVPTKAGRFGQPYTQAEVCLPGTRGFIGDRCFDDGECQDGRRCDGADLEAGRAGLCTEPCTRFCPDMPGAPTTFCAGDASSEGDGQCVRGCAPESNASACTGGQSCEALPRRARAGAEAYGCVDPTP
jgi:hypothetical protein